MFNLITVSVTSVVACDSKQQQPPPIPSSKYPVNKNTLPTDFPIVPSADKGSLFPKIQGKKRIDNYYQNDNLNLDLLTKENITDRQEARAQAEARDDLNEILGQSIDYSDPETIKLLNKFINYTNNQLSYRASTNEITAYKNEIETLLKDMVSWGWTKNGTFSPEALDTQSLNTNDPWNEANKFSSLFNYWPDNRKRKTQQQITEEETADALSYAWAKSEGVPIQQLLGETVKAVSQPGSRTIAYVGVSAVAANKEKTYTSGLRSMMGVGRIWDSRIVADAQYRQGFWSTNRSYSVFTHEFAHALDFYCGNKNPEFKQNYNLRPSNPIPFQNFSKIIAPISPSLMHQWVPEAAGLPKNDLLAAVLMDWSLIPSNYGRNPIIPESFAEAYAYWLLTPIQNISWVNGQQQIVLNNARLGTAWAFWNNFFLNSFKKVFPV